MSDKGGYRLTNEQARDFMLLHQGLLGPHKFLGAQGIVDFVAQAGCVQYDPIDVCGKNADLVLQARVPGFDKDMLYELLYKQRKLVDYFDKNLAIVRASDWKYFARTRDRHRRQGRSRDQVEEAADEVMRFIRENGPASSKDVPLKATVDWSWNPTTLSRAVLETLYFRGELIVHHKKGTIKYYAYAEDHLDAEHLRADDPHPEDSAFRRWSVLRRIRAVGLLWNKPSDAWLGIDGLKSAERAEAFRSLLEEGKIVPCAVEGISDTLYVAQEDEAALKFVLANSSPSGSERRVEFIAPLDSLIWDRKLIRALFGFDYKWEIYTPVAERKYGYYVLPVLCGNRFAGRIELVADKKARRLNVIRYWPEPDERPDDAFRALLRERLARFAAFNRCELGTIGNAGI